MSNLLSKLPAESVVQAKEPHFHVFGRTTHIVCNTEPRGYKMPENRSLFEHRVHTTEGIVPLWEQEQTLRWHFQERSLSVFAHPEQLKSYLRHLLGKVLESWGNAAPIKFTEQDDAWDFEISVKSEKDCDINGCVAASAFFPDDGRHDFVVHPSLFDLSADEQLETFIHETGHIFGLRHWFANISETGWPSVQFGSDSRFTVMNYGDESVFTDQDKQDLAQLYRSAWDGTLAEINGTPIRFVRPYHMKRYLEEGSFASRLVQTASALQRAPHSLVSVRSH